MASDKKEKILEATITLLTECQDVKDVTTRRIAEKAGVNPAMINYYYKSKDNLLIKSLKRILASFLSEQDVKYDSNKPKEALEAILGTFVCGIMTYKKYLSTAVPKILMEDEIFLSNLIAPLVKKYYGSTKSEAECKLLSYRAVSFILLVFYRSDAVKDYCGLDVNAKDQCCHFVKNEISIMLGEPSPVCNKQ